MKKSLWISIIILLGAILLVLYTELDESSIPPIPQSEDTLSQSAEIPQQLILYTTGTILYDEVRLDPNLSEQVNIYKQLSSSHTCKQQSYGIGGGEDSCEQVSGYTHNYKLPDWGITLHAYGNIQSSFSNNPGILSPSIYQPFIVSGSQLYDYTNQVTGNEYLEYHHLSPTQTIPDIINQAKKDQGQYIYDPGGYGEFESGFVYQFLYRKGDEYPTIMTYHFHPSKNYYYIFKTQDSCTPGPCDLQQHKIDLFQK